MAMSTGSEPRRPRFNLLSGPDLSANGMPCVARGKALGISISTSVPDFTPPTRLVFTSLLLAAVVSTLSCSDRSRFSCILYIYISCCTTLVNDFKRFLRWSVDLDTRDIYTRAFTQKLIDG